MFKWQRSNHSIWSLLVCKTTCITRKDRDQYKSTVASLVRICCLVTCHTRRMNPKDKLSFDGSYWCRFKRENSWYENQQVVWWRIRKPSSSACYFRLEFCKHCQWKREIKVVEYCSKEGKIFASVPQLRDAIRINADVFKNLKNCFVISMECQMK